MAMNETLETREELVSFFEESFRSIEASRLGEAILALCSSEAEKATSEMCHD